MHRRIQASAFVEARGLTRVTVSGVRFEVVDDVIELILGEDITAEFVCVVQRTDGTADVVLGVRATAPDAEEMRAVDVSSVLAMGTLEVSGEVAMLGVYGPHFREKPGILGAFLSALGHASIPVLGVASSISSLCALLPESKVEAARTALEQVFETP